MKSLLDGSKGVYRGISYVWIADGDVDHLYITDHGKTILLDTGQYNQKRFEEAYHAMTKCLIDVYLSEKETESMLNDITNQVKGCQSTQADKAPF